MIRMITDPQAAFVGRLLTERGLAHDPEAVAALTFAEARAEIDRLLAMPRPKGAQAEPGFYIGEDGDAIRVVANKAGTGTYAKRFTVAQGKASWDYAPGLARTLAGLTPMTGPQAAALGIQSGFCVRCCAALGGETLSARCSAIVGYGAHCAKQEGWAFPHKVAEQRALIAKHAAPVAA